MKFYGVKRSTMIVLGNNLSFKTYRDKKFEYNDI